MRLLSFIILLFVALLSLSFALLNASPVPFNYYIGSKTLPLSLLLVGAFILGIVFGFLLLYPKILFLKFELHRMRKGMTNKTGN